MKILLIILVLVSTRSFGQMKLFAVKLNTNATLDSFYRPLVGNGIYNSSGNYVMPSLDSMQAIEGFEMPQSLGKFIKNADGVYRNFTDKMLYSDLVGTPSTFTPSAHSHPASEISDGTTVGRNLLTLPNPDAATFPRINANNTITPRTGAQVKADLNIDLVDNTSDANKPVSAAQQTALNLKANLASPAFTGTPTGITATHVGLGNVDNTSDATKNAAAANLTNKTIGGFNAALDAGANDSYVITLSPAPAAYTTGMIVIFRANTANTTGCTINVNGLGVKAINKRVSTATATGDILALMWCMLIYDGANFIILNPIVN